ncbi:MAG: CDP-alcohol phosphatidyltransferase family protein [Bacteroidaceae bacterium]|nr:CDP-alcohol phosphatidyltransferase family protein [Bacteroidaceae bacterium]
MITFQQFRDGIQHAVYFLIDKPVRLLVRLGVTPNMMTTVGLLGNILAAALFVYSALYEPANDFTLVGYAGLVCILFSIFDMVDGYMARTANLCSTFGAFYDSVLDRYCELFVLSGMAFYFVQHGYAIAAVITFLSLIGSIMVSYVRARAEGLGLECKVGLMQRPERVVLTSLGAMFCGLLAPYVKDTFDPMWILIIPQILIAILANYTAFRRIHHVYKLLKNK